MQPKSPSTKFFFFGKTNPLTCNRISKAKIQQKTQTNQSIMTLDSSKDKEITFDEEESETLVKKKTKI